MPRGFRDAHDLQPWWVAAATAKSAWWFVALYGLLAVVSLAVYLFGSGPWWFLIAAIFFALACGLFLASAVYLMRARHS